MLVHQTPDRNVVALLRQPLLPRQDAAWRADVIVMAQLIFVSPVTMVCAYYCAVLIDCVVKLANCPFVDYVLGGGGGWGVVNSHFDQFNQAIINTVSLGQRTIKA